MSGWTTLPADLSKFAVTGVLAFLASFSYTNYATSPTRNITIVPLSVEHDVACDVNRAALLEKLYALRGAVQAAPTPEPEVDYGKYVTNALGMDGRLHHWGPWPILKNLIPGRIARQLEEDGILVCTGADANLPTHALLRGHAVILLTEPRSYAMSRSCSLKAGQLEVPVRAMESEVPVMKLGESEPNTTITIKEAMNLFFRYDPEDAPRVSGRSLGDLMRVLSGRDEYELSIACPIVAPGGPIGVTGRAFPFKNQALIGIVGEGIQLAAQ
jgi:hypothetical protein